MASQDGRRLDAAEEAGMQQLMYERTAMQVATGSYVESGSRADAATQTGLQQLAFERAMITGGFRFDAVSWFLAHTQDVHNHEVADHVASTRLDVGQVTAQQPAGVNTRLIDFLKAQHAAHHAPVPGDDGPLH